MKNNPFLASKENRYAIRKYSVGAASIIIGSVIFMSNGSVSFASEKIETESVDITSGNQIGKSQEAHDIKAQVENKESLNQTNDTNDSNNSASISTNSNLNETNSDKSNLNKSNKLPSISSESEQKVEIEKEEKITNKNGNETSLNEIENDSSSSNVSHVIAEESKIKGKDSLDKNNVDQDKQNDINTHRNLDTSSNIKKINSDDNRTKVRKARSIDFGENRSYRDSGDIVTQVSTDGTVTYRWYPVTSGLTEQELSLIKNGRFGDAETVARKKATMLWLLANFDFSTTQTNQFKVKDINSPNFGEDVYKWLEEAKNGNITSKQGTMNLGRKREMFITATNIILSNRGSYDRAIVNFGSKRNFMSGSNSSDGSNLTNGFKLNPPYEKVVVNNTWYLRESDKENIRNAIRESNEGLDFININFDSNGNVFAYVNQNGQTIQSAFLQANEVIIDRITVEKNERLSELLNLVGKVKLVEGDAYIPSSYGRLQEKLNIANIVINKSYDPNINNIPDIINAKNELQSAYDQLVLKANMSELNDAINTAKAQGPFDESNAADKAIQDAIADGENIASNINNPQDVVNQAKDRILNALANREQLKEKITNAQNKVNEAEAADAKAKEKLEAYQGDGLITPAEKQELENLANEATTKKTEAENAVNSLPDNAKGDLAERLSKLTSINVPEVNDADGNGIADDVDASKAEVENKVAEAEEADAKAKEKLEAYQGDGLITPTEKQELENLANEATAKKAEAENGVNGLPDNAKGNLPERLSKLTGINVPEVNDADGNGIADDVDASKAEAENAVNGLPDNVKGDLPERLNKLTGISVPEVNDADGNGIADEVDASKVEADQKVSEAEAADTKAKEKLEEHQGDGLITSAEKQELENLANEATAKKAEAENAVNGLPDNVKGDLPERLNKLTGISVPEVNDADGNGIADEVDTSKVEADQKVSEAEVADAKAKEKLEAHQGDGLITPAEKEELENLANEATAKKAEAENAVNGLPDNVKGDLPERLNKLTGISVPEVNDNDGNGIVDSIDKLVFEANKAIKKAEQSHKDLKGLIQETKTDGLVTRKERIELEKLLDKLNVLKEEAQLKVNILPDELKHSLVDRLNKLETITLPSVNNNSIKHNDHVIDSSNQITITNSKNDLSETNDESKQGKKHKNRNNNVNAQNTLPKTGEKDVQNTTLLGTILAILGTVSIAFRRNKEKE